jgi:hypothetical protein
MILGVKDMVEVSVTLGKGLPGRNRVSCVPPSEQVAEVKITFSHHTVKQQ